MTMLKPRDVEFDLLDRATVEAVVSQYDVGELLRIDSLVIYGDNVLNLLERSQTSRKMALSCDRGRYFLKQVPWYCESRAQRRFSAGLAEYLSSAGIPAPRVLLTTRGEQYAQVDGAWYTLHELLMGETYSFKSGQNLAAAETLAYFHAASAGFIPEPDAPTMSLQAVVASHVELAMRVGSERGDDVSPLAAACSHSLLSVSTSALPRVPVHGDYIPWNLAFDGERNAVRAVYDFDNACMDSRLHDVGESIVAWSCLDYVGSSSELAHQPRTYIETELASAFLRAYDSVLPLSDCERGFLPAFVLGAWWEAVLLSYVKGEQSTEVFAALPVLVESVERWADVL